MKSRPIDFENRGGLRLSARLDLPAAGAPRAYALYAHCFTCNKDLTGAFHLSRALTDAGLAVLRFDFTGLGQSEGDFADTGFTSSVADLEDAAAFLAREHKPAGLLIGHSLGGAAVLMAAAKIDSVKAVATIGAPADPAHVLHHLADQRHKLEAEGEARIMVAGRGFTLRRRFLDDLTGHRFGEALDRLDRPLLVLHAPLDETVGIDHAARLFAAARHPKSFVSLDRADHLLTRPEDARYAGVVIAAWASRYLASPADGSVS
jgi:pimeloyl-ACP methyl ester carboxylesterase